MRFALQFAELDFCVLLRLFVCLGLFGVCGMVLLVCLLFALGLAGFDDFEFVCGLCCWFIVVTVLGIVA